MALLPFAIDPFGRFRPILNHILLDHCLSSHIQFPPSKPNASAMYLQIMTFSCPKGILTLIDHRWKTLQTRQFFGHSYNASTPSITTLQRIGLCLSKSFASHIRYYAFKRSRDPSSSNRDTSTTSRPHHCLNTSTCSCPPSTELVPIYNDHPTVDAGA
jgi:hypothetical protein